MITYENLSYYASLIGRQRETITNPVAGLKVIFLLRRAEDVLRPYSEMVTILTDKTNVLLQELCTEHGVKDDTPQSKWPVAFAERRRELVEDYAKEIEKLNEESTGIDSGISVATLQEAGISLTLSDIYSLGDLVGE